MLFTIRQSFDAQSGEGWLSFLDWLGRRDLVQVLTLDTMLCPPVPLTIAADEDLFLSEELADFYTDLDLLLEGDVPPSRSNILAAIPDPSPADVDGFGDSRFVFAGYDLWDLDGIASALLNCGGFPMVFLVDELSAASGLITSHERAYDIRAQLSRHYPDEPHAVCRVWAIWHYQR